MLDVFILIIIYDLFLKYMCMWLNNKKCFVYLFIYFFLLIIYLIDSWEKIIGRGGNLVIFEIKYCKFFFFEFFLVLFFCFYKVFCYVVVNLRGLW